jgi:phosphoglycolate phosphatase-like HAD superfamily hydrolase
MSKIKRLGFDLDGVLVDILPSLLQAGKDRGIVPLKTEVEDIHEGIHMQFGWSDEEQAEVLTPEFFYNLPPKIEIIEQVQEWLYAGCHITYITARHEDSKKLTIKWLDDHSLWRNSNGLYSEKSAEKYKKAKELDLFIFVDDHQKVIKEMIGNIPHPFLLATHLNENECEGYRYDWPEIKNEINELIGFGRFGRPI